MKRTIILSLVGAAFLAANAAAPEKPWQYVDAQDLRVINKGFADSEKPYWRLPAELKDSVRTGLWNRQTCSAGMGVRFATNSSRIGARYNLLYDAHMLHMADTGIKGSDLYVLEGDSVWRHVNTNRPKINNKEEKMCEALYVSNLDTTKMTQYMIYFPLYDGVEKFEVKVDSLAKIDCGKPEIIDKNRKIVAYGTSILQGGCASRTGNAATNMISRELNCEVVNLGFSGEGKMDSCVARAMARIPDVDLFIIDPVPNCTEMMCDTLTYGFIDILRTLRPEVPILMVEGPIYPYARYDSFFGNYLPKKNVAYHKGYEQQIAQKPENLYYIDSVNLDGPEDDGTVDGIHLTDLGFRHYANKLLPKIREILGW